MNYKSQPVIAERQTLDQLKAAYNTTRLHWRTAQLSEALARFAYRYVRGLNDLLLTVPLDDPHRVTYARVLRFAHQEFRVKSVYYRNHTAPAGLIDEALIHSARDHLQVPHRLWENRVSELQYPVAHQKVNQYYAEVPIDPPDDIRPYLMHRFLAADIQGYKAPTLVDGQPYPARMSRAERTKALEF
jgi:hypothetical protein